MKRFLDFFSCMSLQGKVAFVLLGTLLPWWAILAGRYYFGDDRVRVFTHTTLDQGVQGRFLNDIFYGFFSAGLFVDLSPWSRILCLFSIILCGYILIKVFDARRHCENFWPFLPLLLALFPLNSMIVVYRYDSPGFGLSFLFSVLAFSCAVKKRISLNILAAILVFVSLCIYQIFLNAFLMLVCFYVAKKIMENAKMLDVAWNFGKSIIIAIAGCLLYLPVSWHAKIASMQPFADLPNYPGSSRFETIFNSDFIRLLQGNIDNYLDAIWQFFGSNFIIYFFVGIVLFSLCSLFFCTASLCRKICAMVMLFMAFIAVVALNLVLRVSVFSPRACILLGLFCFMLLLFSISRPLWRKIPKFAAFSTILFVLYFSLCTNTLTMIGTAYEEQRQFENFAIIEPLSLDFANLVQEHGRISFTAVGTTPLNYTYRIIRQKYGFLDDNPTFATFLAFGLLSWFPSDYLLEPERWPDKSKYPVIKKRLYYEIREISPNQYYIVFDQTSVPYDLKKFQTPYKLKY